MKFSLLQFQARCLRWATICLLATSLRAESGYRLLGPADFEGLATRVELEPGDYLLLPEAKWENATLRFRGKGTREKPVTLRPLKPGSFTLKGNSCLIVEGDWLVVEGVKLESTADAPAVIMVQGQNNRITACDFPGATNQSVVKLTGSAHVVDHCRFSGVQESAITMDSPPERSAGHTLLQNTFGALH